MIRTYDELMSFKTYEERIRYLRVKQKVAKETFGPNRYLNQAFYKSPEWLSIRNRVIIRDLGCDLGLEGYEINDEPVYIHHMNPITEEDIINRSEFLLNPKYLICVTKATHDLIHYGSDILLQSSIIQERRENDTCPWK
mgnify:FL=1